MLEIDIEVTKKIHHEEVYNVIVGVKKELLDMEVGEERLVELNDLGLLVKRTEKGLYVYECLELI